MLAVFQPVFKRHRVTLFTIMKSLVSIPTQLPPHTGGNFYWRYNKALHAFVDDIKKAICGFPFASVSVNSNRGKFAADGRYGSSAALSPQRSSSKDYVCNALVSGLGRL